MSRGDLGKQAEAEVTKWLNAASALHANFAFHRFPDSRAARGALAAQPADFLVATYFGGVARSSLLEVKETENTARLPKSKIGQYGMLKKFDMAGMDVFVLVYRSKLADWTYLTANDLFSHEETPASFPFTYLSFPTATYALNRIYRL
jgi:hypothetical protein